LSTIEIATPGQASAVSRIFSKGTTADDHRDVVEAEDLGRNLDTVAVGAALVGVHHGYVGHTASSALSCAGK
jgi:hypothetical protein